MPKYLVRASYTTKGAGGLLEEGGSSRREAVEKMVAGAGGSLEAFYFAFGDDDVIAIVEAPDDASAAALSLAVGAAGAVDISLTVLIDPATIDEAAKKGASYRPPGG